MMRQQAAARQAIYASQRPNNDPEPRVNLDENGNEKPGTRHGRYADCSALCVERPRPKFDHTRDPEPWHVTLTSAKGHNGRWREWRGAADDWDDALAHAEAANPGWNAHTGGYLPRHEQFDVPVNRVLVEFRADRVNPQGDGMDDPRELLDAMDQPEFSIFNDFTPEELDHARRVLTKIVNVFGNSEKES